MSQTVQYHLEEDDRFAIAFVSPDRDEVKHEELARQCDTTETEVRTYSLDQDVSVLYTATDPAREIPDDYRDELSAHNGPILKALLNGFRGIRDEEQAQGNQFRWYKEMEIRRISGAIDRIEWKQPIPEVGGQLLSELILQHGLPNANHRSAITLLETYLESRRPSFEMPSTGSVGHWEPWAREYIEQSKRLLTVRRNVWKLRLLHEWGCSTVIRKNGIEVFLSSYDWESDGLKRQLKNEHYDQSIEFVNGLLERSNNQDMKTMIDDGKQTFIQRLEQS